jgi:hypothetical protein
LGVSDYHNVIVIVSSYGHLKKKANPKNEWIIFSRWHVHAYRNVSTWIVTVLYTGMKFVISAELLISLFFGGGAFFFAWHYLSKKLRYLAVARSSYVTCQCFTYTFMTIPDVLLIL